MEAIKKVLVTGAGGLLGRYLAKELKESFKVTGTCFKNDIDCSGIDKRRLDLSEESAVKRIVDERPDYIIHTAGLTNVDYCQLNPQQAYLANVVVTINVARACQKLSARLIYISTDHVFSGEKKDGYKEDDQTDPVNIYGRTKLQAEETVKNILRDFFIVRVSWLFGDAGKGFLNLVLDSAKKNKFVDVVDDKWSSPTSVIDLSRALKFLLLLENRPGEVFHFTNNGPISSWFEYAQGIISAAGINDAVLRPISLEKLKLAAPRPRYSGLCNGKFAGIYPQKIATWQDALKEVFKLNKKNR